MRIDIITEAEAIVQDELRSRHPAQRYLKEREERAVAYRQRWERLGLICLTVILLFGLIVTPNNQAGNLLAFLLAGLMVASVSVLIGAVVYYRRSPW